MDMKSDEATSRLDDALNAWVNIAAGVKYRSQLDNQCTILDIEPQSQALTGYTPEQIINNHAIAFAELIDPAYREQVWKVKKDAHSRHEPFQLSYRITTKDGSQRIIWEQGETVADISNGEVTEGVMVDVTKILQDIENPTDTKYRFSKLVEMAPIGIVIVRNGIISYGNALSLNMFSFQHSGEVLGKRVESLIPRKERAHFIKALKSRESGEDINKSFEIQTLRKDQKPIKIRVSTILLDPEQKILVGFLSDITEDVKSLNRLIESENKFHQIFTNSPEGVFVERLTDRTILDVNPAYERMTGISKTELVGKRLNEVGIVTPPEYQDVIVHEFLSTGGLSRREIPLTRRDGSTIWTEISAQKTVMNGQECFLCFVSDRTNIKNFESRIKKGLEDTITAISIAIEKRDAYIAGHQSRVEMIAELIATELNLTEEDIHPIKLAASIHDIGKINIPAEILSKPGKISALEFELIKTHSQVGYDIVKNIDFPWPIADMIRQHHERIDGSGYPDGLSGDEILLGAKIIGVADVIEAMSSHRPYRPALGIDIALEEIKKNRGILYDPEVVDAACAVIENNDFHFAW